jgi:hypothetical protein
MAPPEPSSFGLTPTPNNDAFSKKNCLRSGKKTENLVTLFTCRSASACAKSVLIVTSRILFGLIAHLMSPPARKLFFSGSVDAGKFL